MTALQIYDVRTDEFRVATQEDLDTICHIAVGEAMHREAQRLLRSAFKRIRLEKSVQIERLLALALEIHAEEGQAAVMKLKIHS